MNGRTRASCPIMKVSSYLRERSGLAITHLNKVQPLSEAMAGLFPPAVMTVHVGGNQMVGLLPLSGREGVEAVNNVNVFWIGCPLEIFQMGTLTLA